LQLILRELIGFGFGFGLDLTTFFFNANPVACFDQLRVRAAMVAHLVLIHLAFLGGAGGPSDSPSRFLFFCDFGAAGHIFVSIQVRGVSYRVGALAEMLSDTAAKPIGALFGVLQVAAGHSVASAWHRQSSFPLWRRTPAAYNIAAVAIVVLFRDIAVEPLQAYLTRKCFAAGSV
jgi:hypothetical protein